MSTAQLGLRITADLAAAEKALQGFSGKVQGLGKDVSAVGGSMTKWVTGPALAVGGALFTLGNRAANFGKQMNEVFTLLPGITADAMGAMKADVKAFAVEAGVLPEKVVPALYQAISAGVPKENVFEFLRVANMAAIGGVSDLQTAVDGISSVVNAYGAEVLDAAQASDLMFTAVRLGKTDFQQLSQSLFNVIPTASALGVKFGDVTAALARLTAQGTPTAVATTQMRQLLVELSKAGSGAAVTFERMAGMSLKKFIAAGGNTADALELMEKAAKEMGLDLKDLFSSVEAGNAAMGLAGPNMAGYRAALDEMANGAGATEAAYAQMEQGGARAMERMKVELSTMALTVGDKVLPVLEKILLPLIRDHLVPAVIKFAGWVGGLIDKFMALDPQWQKVIGLAVGLAIAIGPVLMVGGKLITIFSAILSPVGLLVAAIAGLIAVFVHLWQTNEQFREIVTQVWNTVQAVFSSAVNAIKALLRGDLNDALDYVRDVFDRIFGSEIADTIMQFVALATDAIRGFTEWMREQIQAALEIVRQFWEEHGERILASAQRIWETISGAIGTALGIIRDIWAVWGDTILAVAKRAWDQITLTIETAINLVRDIISFVTALLRGDWEGAWNAVKDIAVTVWEFLKSTAGNVFGALRDLLGAIWNVIRDKMAAIWSGILSAAQSVWDRITGTVRSAAGAITVIIDGAIGAIQRAIDWVKNLLGIASSSRQQAEGEAAAAQAAAARAQAATGAAMAEAMAIGRGKVAPPDIHDIPRFQHGGRKLQSGLALVGEAGPELVRLPAGAQVYSNADSRRMASGGSPDIHLHLHGPIYGMLDFEDRVKSVVRDAQRSGAFRGVIPAVV
jgi:TP901 family phage tail tape measure protein